MPYDEKLTAEKLRRWEKYLTDFKLPTWEEIPDLGLYMEQVTVLMKKYLDYMPPKLKEEQYITAAAINNYVRNRFMPKPVSKRYYRVHIAYLIMICTLKQSLSIALVQSLIPVDIPEEEVRRIYDAYALRYKVTTRYFIEQVRLVCGPILGNGETGHFASADDTSSLIETSAIIGGLSKLLAEKLILLESSVSENPKEEKSEEK